MSKRINIILTGIIGVSLLSRIGAALYFGDQVINLPGTFDQISYHNLAIRVLTGYGFTFAQEWWPITPAGAPTAHWSFLYTLYLVLNYALFGQHPIAARLIQAILVGILQPVLVYLIARRTFNQVIGVVAAALTAVYAYFIYYSATLMTEPFYITSILASIYLAIRLVDHSRDSELPQRALYFWGIGLGLTLGIAVLFRQLFLLVIPFIYIWIWWASRSKSAMNVKITLVISSIVLILMILPFTLYNYASTLFTGGTIQFMEPILCRF